MNKALQELKQSQQQAPTRASSTSGKQIPSPQNPAVVSAKLSSSWSDKETASEPFPDIDPYLASLSAFPVSFEYKPSPCAAEAFHLPVIMQDHASQQSRESGKTAPCAAAMVPPGWPFPGVDMSRAHFETSGEISNNGLNPAANPFGPCAPFSEHQIDSASLPPYQRSLGSPGPALKSDAAVPFTSPSPDNSEAPPVRSTFKRLPQTNLDYLCPSATDMQYISQAQGQEQMFHMAQPALQPMMLQNNFAPQNDFRTQQSMLAQSMMHPHNMMLTSPSPVSTPVPSQYQNDFSNQIGPMVPYQNSFMELQPLQQPRQLQQFQQAQVSVTQPSAMRYRFHVKGAPPFVDLTRDVASSEKPIICIKNIPYTITHNEIQQFLSKSLLPHSLTYLTTPGPAALPIHVIMERGTGKTQDCYVELPSEDIARICIERVENLVMAGKPPKMAQRIVNVDVSSQGELMKEIFPRAKNMLWDTTTGIPIMLKPVDSFCSGFRGFLTGEELNNVVRLAETPQRSPFATRCQQRTYEMTMSTLAKFPWASIYYTLDQRDQLFRAYLNQLSALLPKVFVEEYGGSRNQRVVGLDARLVATFVDAGLNCPGFNEAQKSDILEMTNQNFAYRGVSEYAPAWPFETLSKPAGVGDQDLEKWLWVLTVGAMSAVEQQIDLSVGEADRKFVEVKFLENGNVFMEISEEGRTKVGFADLARMETQLMKCMLLHGWEKSLGRSGLDLYNETEGEQLSEVEKKMLALGCFELGIDRPDPRLESTKQDTGQPILNKDKAVVVRDDDPARHPCQEQGQEVRFEDPFHGRARSVASDSGFSDMHRGLEMNEMLKEVREMAQQVHCTAPASKMVASIEKNRPSYSAALGNILVDTDIANASARTGTGSSAVSIKSPDGKELEFSKNTLTPASSNTRYSSPERDSHTFDPFNTPRRRSGSSTGSSGNVSPRTRTSSPKKSFTVKASPSPANVLSPFGTPSRRSLQDNTIKIGATISEEGEDESIMMRGGRGRGRGSFRSTY